MMPGEKIRLPLKEELLNAMKVAETSTEAADYLVVRFTDILTKAKMLAESQDIIAKVQDYAKYVHFKLLSNAQPWSGESVPSSDFKNMQENLAKDLVQFEENQSISEQQMDEITEIYSKVYDIITACDK